VVEFGCGRRQRSVKSAERDQRRKRKKYALHLVDSKKPNSETEKTEFQLVLLLVLCFNAMVDRDG